MGKVFLFLVLVLTAVPSWATSPEDYYNAGMDLMKQKDYEKAVQYFRAAVDQRPDYWQAYQFLGEAYYQAANRTEAVVAMQESLRLHPDNTDLRKFMEKIKRSSPWAASGAFKDWMPLISILLSLLTLGWTLYSTSRYRLKRNDAPPRG